MNKNKLRLIQRKISEIVFHMPERLERCEAPGTLGKAVRIWDESVLERSRKLNLIGVLVSVKGG